MAIQRKSYKWIYAYEKARKKGKSPLEAKVIANKTIKKRKTTNKSKKNIFDFRF